MNIHNQELVPFPNAFSYYICIFILFLNIFIVALNAVAVYFNGKRLDSASSIFIQSLCLADLVFGLIQVIFLPSQIVHGGFSWGAVGCNLNFYLTMVSIAISILSIASIAIEKYLATNWFTDISRLQSGLWAVFLWIYPMVAFSSPFLFGFSQEIVTLTEDSLFCLVRWNAQDFSSQFLIWVVILSLFFIFSATIFSYTNVFLSYHRARKNSLKKQKTKNEKAILKKCLALTLVFLCAWIPECCKIAYQITTKKSVDPLFDTLSSFCVTLNAMLDPLMVTLLDARLKQDIKKTISWFFKPKLSKSSQGDLLHHLTVTDATHPTGGKSLSLAGSKTESKTLKAQSASRTQLNSESCTDSQFNLIN